MTGTIRSLNPTFVTETGTTSSNDAVSKDFTVSGSGYVVASISVQAGNNEDYGSTGAIISKNGTTIAACTNRFSTANKVRAAANASAGFPVSDGDVIGTELFCTKTGTKTLYRNFLCFGCTVS